VIERDYEGLVAKDQASLYEAGPTRPWLKVKQSGWTVDEDPWQPRISAARASDRTCERRRRATVSPAAHDDQRRE